MSLNEPIIPKRIGTIASNYKRSNMQAIKSKIYNQYKANIPKDTSLIAIDPQRIKKISDKSRALQDRNKKYLPGVISRFMKENRDRLNNESSAKEASKEKKPNRSVLDNHKNSMALKKKLYYYNQTAKT